MAESKFLQYQDKNGDLLIDQCEDLVPPGEPSKCPPECVPNPFAIVPNWKSNTKDDPFFNEKNCKYQITIVTPYESTNAPPRATEEEANAAVQEIYQEFASLAAEYLLVGFNKDNSTISIQTIEDSIEYTDYYLDYRPTSKLKLLFSVDKAALDNIEDGTSNSDEDEDEDESFAGGDHNVTYDADDMVVKLLKIRKGLNLYNRYLKVYRAIDEGNLVFEDGNRVFNLENYGDPGVGPGTSTMAKILKDLDKFLNRNDMNIKGVASTAFFKKEVTKIEFVFNGKYKLKKLKAWTVDCGEKSTVFKGKKLESLQNSDSFRDKTAMAYLTKLEAMDNDLSARTPKPWIEFLIEHTYPKLQETFGFPVNQPDPGDTVGSAIARSLKNEGKQLGQDILDEVFSLGDAVAYQFHRSLCVRDRLQIREEDLELGLRYDLESRQSRSIRQMATEQAFKTIEAGNDVFGDMCFAFIESAGDYTTGLSLRDLWYNNFENIKLCGLSEFMIDGIKCLMQGLTLEQSLSKILLSTMNSMEIQNLGKLFVGLPQEQQDRIEALVTKKLTTGNLFATNSNGQQMSDLVNKNLEVYDQRLTVEAAGQVRWYRPWQNAELVRQNVDTPSTQTQPQFAEAPSRTLARTLDVRANIETTAENQLSPDIVLQAYILALLEVYQDDLLSVVDFLNKFPGAQIISKVIAMLDCPGPPISDPSVMDFIKSIELPFCRSVDDIVLPRFQNPAAWIPEFTDLSRLLFQIIINEIKELIIRIVLALLVKICELLGKLVCKSLETAGSLANALSEMVTGEDSFRDAIRSGITGQQASDEDIENTIAEMLAAMGAGGAALADREQVSNFVSDLSSATTAQELMNAFLGNPSDEFLSVVNSLIRYNYPDFSDGLSNKSDVASFFNNCGNLFPAEFNQKMQDFVNNAPDEQVPANPSICADPSAVDDFCEMRANMLVDSGRATREQALAMCNSTTGDLLDDLGDLTSALQSALGSDGGGLPEYIANNLPPIVSEPGCDNGIIPYETEQMVTANTVGLDGELEKLKTLFTIDMLGDGPGDAKWGMLNMMMCDTFGNPLTTHNRKVALNPAFVDFYYDGGTTDADAGGAGWLPVQAQIGAYPAKIAEWLQEQLSSTDDIEFISSNTATGETSFKSGFENYGFKKNIFGVMNINLYDMPIRDYNVNVSVDYENEKIITNHISRKKDPDINLTFKDNADGFGTLYGAAFSEGFRMELYFADKNDPFYNVRGDNMRIKIFSLENPSSMILNTAAAFVPDLSAIKPIGNSGDEEEVIEDLLCEFIATDDTLNNFDSSFNAENYPEFFSCFETDSSPSTSVRTTTANHIYMPQIVLLSEITGIDKSVLKDFYDTTMTNLFKTFMTEVAQADDNPAFDYGAMFDDLTYADMKYLVPEGQINAGEKYAKGRIEEDGEERKIKNSDAILGVSQDMWDNMENNTPEKTRVFYLDPAKFGGTYNSPPVYVKPMQNKGWMGLLDVLFPDFSDCGDKAAPTDLVNFEEIQSNIEKVYPTLAEDKRLKSNKDCVIELPYNRILNRYATAGLEGLIIAACRIYAATHVIRTIPVFMKFNPSFEDMFSSIYASYIVEDMETEFKDAQGDFVEAFNNFKDNEFWYAFLEQAVQMYARKVDSGDIDPPREAIRALMKLNRSQDNYKSLYPQLEPDPEIDPLGEDGYYLKTAKDLKHIGRFTTLEQFRNDKNLEVIYSTASTAKIILKHLVMEQVNVVGKKLIKNLETLDLGPNQSENSAAELTSDMKFWSSATNYILNKLTSGSTLDLENDSKQEFVGLPTEDNPDPFNDGSEYPGPYYTNGGDFSTEEGENYVGFYHVHTSETGDVSYMKGEYHVDEAHDSLRPLMTKVSVPIGSVSEYGASVVSSGQIYALEKYISIDGEKFAPSVATANLSSLASSYGGLSDEEMPNISDLYPGTPELVEDPFGTGRIIGLSGQLGVRYGLEFSVIVNGNKSVVTTVELDMLDTKINDIQPFDNNSKLLLCLVNMLKKDQKFKIITDYVFPVKKILSSIAIYTDKAFIPSIGQVCAEPLRAIGPTATLGTKPGMQVAVSSNSDGEITDVTMSSNPGWASPIERFALAPSPNSPVGIIVQEWDQWDQTTLKMTKSAIKRQLKQFYYERDFEVKKTKRPKAGDLMNKKLKAAFKPVPGQKILPRWQKKRLRSNPFDVDGNLCDDK